MHLDAIGRIEASLITLVRRANDPRGNQRLNEAAGTDVERAGAVMLSRIRELQPVRLSVVADAAGVEISTASRQVGKLVEDGYVERATDPADGRASTLSLTPTGADVRDRLDAARRAWIEELLQGFDPADRDVLATLMEQFVGQMAEGNAARR